MNDITIIGALLAGLLTIIINYYIWVKVSNILLVLFCVLGFVLGIIGGLLFGIPLIIISWFLSIIVKHAKSTNQK